MVCQIVIFTQLTFEEKKHSFDGWKRKQPKGASGAGKTTLLNVLNFRNRGNLKISGDVKINGEVIKSTNDLANVSGYVQQDDLFLAPLKVKEQLRFQVRCYICFRI